MEIRYFLAEDYPALVAIHASQNIVYPERPGTAEVWMEADRRRSPKCKHQRWMATVDDQAVGFAAYSQFTGEYNPRMFYINVEVLPEYRRRGIGSALYETVMDGLWPQDPSILRADAFTNIPQGFDFLQKRGFYEAFRETPVQLEVSRFDCHSYADLEFKLASQGIHLRTVRELASDPDRDRKIFAMYRAADMDVPHEDLGVEEIQFEEWLSWGLDESSVLLDAYLIAVYGKEYVGIREVGRYAGDVLIGSLMGVRRDFRKRGIAQALMVRNILYAQEHGYRLLKDCTAVQNLPMQALFNRLGFTRDPEWQQMQKNI
jgi:mycothiol synthase